jgi:hypothetical protein
MTKMRLTVSQLYWLGRLVGYYVNNDGSCAGSRGYAEWTVNPGRADGAEYTLETLHRKGLVVWINTYRMIDNHGGNGFALTEAGLAQWMLHFPNRPMLNSGRGKKIKPQPTPHEPGESPTYIPRKKRPEPIRARPFLTDEELRHLADLFNGANDPVSASIAAKIAEYFK